MIRKWMMLGLAASFASSVLAQINTSLSADQIVAKNVAARGGLKAWRAVQTLTETGKLGAGGDQRQTQPTQIPGAKHVGKQSAPAPMSPRLAQEAQLPFVLDLERARKMRLEVQFKGQTAVQVYDGANGWKVRPFLNRTEVEAYTEDETRIAALQSDLDGPLVDYAAKNTQIVLEGTEKVEDRDNYRLKITMKNGHSIHVWIDGQTFLESKIEGSPRRLDGLEHPVEVYFRDYRNVDGLQIPFVLETKVLPLSTLNKTKHPVRASGPIPVEKIVIEKVQVNPKLDASLFTKPVIQTAFLAKPK